MALSVGNNNANTTFSGVMSGSGGTLTKIGSGKLTLNGTTPTAAARLSAAARCNWATARRPTASSAGNIANNSALVFANPLTQNYAGNISGSGPVTMSGHGAADPHGLQHQLGRHDHLRRRHLQIANGGNTGSLANAGSNTITDNGVLAFARSDSVTYGNAIGGTGGVEPDRQRQLDLTGAAPGRAAQRSRRHAHGGRRPAGRLHRQRGLQFDHQQRRAGLQPCERRARDI